MANTTKKNQNATTRAKPASSPAGKAPESAGAKRRGSPITSAADEACAEANEVEFLAQIQNLETALCADANEIMLHQHNLTEWLPEMRALYVALDCLKALCAIAKLHGELVVLAEKRQAGIMAGYEVKWGREMLNFAE